MPCFAALLLVLPLLAANDASLGVRLDAYAPDAPVSAEGLAAAEQLLTALSDDAAVEACLSATADALDAGASAQEAACGLAGCLPVAPGADALGYWPPTWPWPEGWPDWLPPFSSTGPYNPMPTYPLELCVSPDHDPNDPRYGAFWLDLHDALGE